MPCRWHSSIYRRSSSCWGLSVSFEKPLLKVTHTMLMPASRRYRTVSGWYQFVMVSRRLGSGGLKPGHPESMALAVSIRPPSQRAKRMRPGFAHSGTELGEGPAGHCAGYTELDADSIPTWDHSGATTAAASAKIRRFPAIEMDVGISLSILSSKIEQHLLGVRRTV